MFKLRPKVIKKITSTTKRALKKTRRGARKLGVAWERSREPGNTRGRQW